MGWVSKIVVLGVVGFLGYSAYDMYEEGYFELGDIPSGSYPISFPSGLRGVVHDMDVTDDQYADTHKFFRRLVLANRDRRFISVPAKVPSWFEDRWSDCRPGSAEEREEITSTMPEEIKRDLVGARLDAICFIEIEGQEPLFRGLIYSIPA